MGNSREAGQPSAATSDKPYNPTTKLRFFRNDDVKAVEDKFEVTCDPALFSNVAAALEAKSVPTERREITRIPTNTVDLNAEDGRKVLKLMEKLDDHDDVQSVASNFNITEAAMAELGES